MTSTYAQRAALCSVPVDGEGTNDLHVDAHSLDTRRADDEDGQFPADPALDHTSRRWAAVEKPARATIDRPSPPLAAALWHASGTAGTLSRASSAAVVL